MCVFLTNLLWGEVFHVLGEVAAGVGGGGDGCEKGEGQEQETSHGGGWKLWKQNRPFIMHYAARDELKHKLSSANLGAEQSERIGATPFCRRRGLDSRI